jgi:hypothetical protein
MQLTVGHVEYLRIENQTTLAVLRGDLTQAEAEHRLRNFQQALGLAPPSGDRVSKCPRCNERRKLEFYLHSDVLDELVCASCGREAERLVSRCDRPADQNGHLTIKRVG